MEYVVVVVIEVSVECRDLLATYLGYFVFGSFWQFIVTKSFDSNNFLLFKGNLMADQADYVNLVL